MLNSSATHRSLRALPEYQASWLAIIKAGRLLLASNERESYAVAATIRLHERKRNHRLGSL